MRIAGPAQLAAAVTTVMLLAAAGATATAPAGAAEPDPVGDLVKAHGFDQWDKVEAIRFTFNVEMGDRTTRRAWHWRPKQNLVRMTVAKGGEADGERTVEYDRDELENAEKRVVDADRNFINDSFWLLLPLHLSWAEQADTQVEVRDTGGHALPLGGGEARRIVVQYPEQGGYTPGDRYELYVNDDGRMMQWTFHRGGAESPTLATRWAGPARLGPLRLHLTRRNGAADFTMTFTNVAVRLEGRDGWIAAEPIKAQRDAGAGDEASSRQPR